MNASPGGSRLRKARLLRVKQAYVADSATVTAEVILGQDTNIWYGVMIRGDDAAITIGHRTNVQDGTVVHVDPGAPNVIGNDVTIGHGAVVHGVEVGSYSLIAMGAILLGGSKIGEGSIVGAGAVVLENAVIPPYSLVVGTPGKVVRTLDPGERKRSAIAHAAGYVEQARRHARGDWDNMISALKG